jgi:hypothetical protein
VRRLGLGVRLLLCHALRLGLRVKGGLRLGRLQL